MRASLFPRAARFRRLPHSSSGGLWFLAFPLLALLPVGALIAGCTDEAPVPPELRTADAGATPCNPGKLACICASSGGCDQGLLCISGRCLATEGMRGEQEPDVRPAYQPPLVSGGGTDGGASSNDAGD